MKENKDIKDKKKTARRMPAEDPASRPAPGRKKKDLMDDLRAQTPSARRRLITDAGPHEPGMRRRTAAHARYRFRAEDEEQDKKSGKRKKIDGTRGLPDGKKPSLFGGRLLLVLMCYLILMPLSLGGFYLWLSLGGMRRDNTYLYQYKENDKVIAGENVERKNVRPGSVWYLDVTRIAGIYGMITTGDSGHIRYLSPDTGESVEFYIDSCLVYVNGLPQRMSADCYTVGETVYAPLDFVTGFFGGMTVEPDRENGKVILSRTSDENGVFPPLTFGYRRPDTTSPLLFSEVDEKTRNEILAREELNRQLELERINGGDGDAEP